MRFLAGNREAARSRERNRALDWLGSCGAMSRDAWDWLDSRARQAAQEAHCLTGTKEVGDEDLEMMASCPAEQWQDTALAKGFQAVGHFSPPSPRFV